MKFFQESLFSQITLFSLIFLTAVRIAFPAAMFTDGFGFMMAVIYVVGAIIVCVGFVEQKEVRLSEAKTKEYETAQVLKDAEYKLWYAQHQEKYKEAVV